MDDLPTIELDPGPWQPPGGCGPIAVGYLVAEGMLLRRVWVGEGRSVELLGKDDLLLPGRDESVSFSRVEWEVVERARLATLDLRPGSPTSRRPGVVAAIANRAIDRSRSFAMQSAIMSIVGVEDRLHAMLWALAERWGKPVPGGAEVDLGVSQGVLAEIIGARRPTVSRALGELCERGLLDVPTPGRWLLRGQPPKRAPLAGRSSARK